jgi:hypothetical protein
MLLQLVFEPGVEACQNGNFGISVLPTAKHWSG